ncbi:MAG TPA: cytochrome c [Polyangia bacterium]|nr:cytochrome c [Polyangia bacterium]
MRCVGVLAALAGANCGTKTIGGAGSAPTPTPQAVSETGGLVVSNPPAFGPTVSAADPPPPVSGGTLTVLAGGAAAAAVDPDRDTVSIVDLGDTPKLRTTVALQRHDEPGRLVEDGDGRLHVVLRRGGAVATIDPVAGTVLDRRAVCSTPRGIAYDPATDRVHVACMDGQLVSLPAAGGAPTRVLQLPRDLRDVVVDGDHLLVSRLRNAEVLTVDAGGDVIRTDTPPSYLDNSAGLGAFTPSTAWRMRPAPGGGALLLHQRGSTDPLMISHGGGYGSSDPCQSPVHPALTPIRAGQTPPMVAPIPGMVLAVDFAVSPDGGQVAVIAAGNAHNPELSTVFVSTFAAMTDQNLHACCPDGWHGPFVAGVRNAQCAGAPPATICPQPTGEVEAVEFDGQGRVVIQTREPATIQLPQAGITISLSDASRADVGHAIFHANSGVGIACASCHAEGQDDGRVWNFEGEGRRRTMTVAGGISQRLPYHWSGDIPEFGSLMAQVYNGRMSGPMLPQDAVSAMAAWMDAIPRPPGIVTDAAAVARGQVLFQDPAHGCALCHAGPQLTNGAVVDVGTGGAFKVPSLVGLAWTPPYLHDGCAATLADRFGACGGGDRHGVTSTLTPAEQADLVAYLDSL